MTSFASLETIREKVQEYGEKINCPPDLLVVRETPDDFGAPHIKVDDQGYHFMITERGKVLKYLKTEDIKALLYLIFQDITSEMAIRYELEHRHPGKDFRRVYFAKQVELMEKLDPQYGEWQQTELDQILEEHPFSDS